MPLVADETMAKKRTPKAEQPTPEWADGKPLIVQMRGSKEFKDWLAKLADHNRTSVTHVIEQALVSYGRSIGFKEDAPKR